MRGRFAFAAAITMGALLAARIPAPEHRAAGRVQPDSGPASAFSPVQSFAPRAADATAGDTASAFTVDGRVALHAFMSLTDAHLRNLADVLTVLASTDAARSGDWRRIGAPLGEAARLTIPAVHWFALPDGRYWTVERGRAAASLADRTYFRRVLAGQTVIGDLVVSRSSSRNTAIVAVPVRGRDGSVTGVLGASVYLDSLAARVRGEMGGLGNDVVFYAIDGNGLGALNSDPTLIFTEPLTLGDAEMRSAFTEMLAQREGTVRYTFRGSRRLVMYATSSVTNWRYGFGLKVP